jgi:hypothetical protein
MLPSLSFNNSSIKETQAMLMCTWLPAATAAPRASRKLHMNAPSRKLEIPDAGADNFSSRISR